MREPVVGDRAGGGAGRRRGSPLVGRRDELRSLAATPSGLVLLRGARGSGRTTVLDHLELRLRTEGRTVLRVRPGAHDPGWDAYGFGALLDAIRSRYEELPRDLARSTVLAATERTLTPAAYASSSGRTAMLAQFGRLLTWLGRPGDLAILIDDASTVAVPSHRAAAAAAAGHLVVAVVDAGSPVPVGREELLLLADAVVDLAALPDQHVATLLRRTVHPSLDRAAVDRIRDGLGPLAGNPAAVVAAAGELVGRGDLVDVLGRVSLRDPDVAVTLPAEHPEVAAVTRLGAAAHDLVALAGGAAAIGVADLPVVACAVDRTSKEYGRALDALVELGVLDLVAGHLAVASPAVAATVGSRSDPARTRRLHAALAGSRTTSFTPAVRADHVVAAGDALAPSPTWTDLLVEEAGRAERCEPHRARQRYRAAWWHAGAPTPGDPTRRATIARRWLDVLLRSGAYDELADVVEVLVRAEPPTGARCDALAALAALASLHVGRPVPDDVVGALTTASGVPAPLALSARWFAGDHVGPAAVVDAFGSLRSSFPAPVPSPHGRRPVPATAASRALSGVAGRHGDELAGALAERDVVTVFTVLFGESYRAPDRGVAALLRRLLADRRAGDWDRALGAAVALLGGDAGDGRTRELATVLGAEIQARQGHGRAARAWLAAAGDAAGDVARRAWVESCLAAGDHDEASRLAAGRALWRRLRADEPRPAVWRLLLRLGVVAVGHADPSWIAWVLDAVRASAAGDDSVVARAHAPVLEAVLRGDPSGAGDGLGALRELGDRVELAWALVGVGTVAPEPAPWLLEAREIARAAGAAPLLARVRATMEVRGVPVPRRTGSTELTGVEQALVEHVRSGRTNRQIANAMRCSEKTVENQLTRLFAKVGCRSRYGLAATVLGVPA